MERYHIFKLGLAVLFYAAFCIRPMVVNGQKIDDEVDNETQTQAIKEEDLLFYQGVQGKPGVDFPTLSHIPRTSFTCREVESGYYADLETDCQVFHICEEHKKISFLCPNGTIFQQSELICDWWFKVNCTNSPNLYEESAEQLREENAKRKLNRRVQNHGAVMRTEERSSVSASRNGQNIDLKKASKRVYNEDGREENRINNHASNYRDDLDQNNDLSKASTSDFIRDRNGNLAIQTHRSGEQQNKVTDTQGRKPVQFQHQPSVDNEERGGERRLGMNGRRNKNNEESEHESSTRNRVQQTPSFGSRNRGSSVNGPSSQRSRNDNNQDQQGTNKEGHSYFTKKQQTSVFGSRQPFNSKTNEGSHTVRNGDHQSSDSSDQSQDSQRIFETTNNDNNQQNSAFGFRNNNRQNHEANRERQFSLDDTRDRIQQTSPLDSRNDGSSFDNSRDYQQSFDRRTNKGSQSTWKVRNGNQQTSSVGSFNYNQDSQHDFDTNTNDGTSFDNKRDFKQSFDRRTDKISQSAGNNLRNGNQQTSSFGSFSYNQNSQQGFEIKTNNENTGNGFQQTSNFGSTNKNGQDQSESNRGQSGTRNDDSSNDNNKFDRTTYKKSQSSVDSNRNSNPQTSSFSSRNDGSSFDKTNKESIRNRVQPTSSIGPRNSNERRFEQFVGSTDNKAQQSSNQDNSQDFSESIDKKRNEAHSTNKGSPSRNIEDTRNSFQQTSSSPGSSESFIFKNDDLLPSTDGKRLPVGSITNKFSIGTQYDGSAAITEKPKHRNYDSDFDSDSRDTANGQNADAAVQDFNNRFFSQNKQQSREGRTFAGHTKDNSFAINTAVPKSDSTDGFNTKTSESNPRQNFYGSTQTQEVSHGDCSTVSSSGVSSGTQKPIPLHINENHQGFSTNRPQIHSSSTTRYKSNINVDDKGFPVNTKSTVPLTRNDIVNKRLEGGDSEEAQIPQETASFYKNSFNRIQQEQKQSSNPHPNHRQTYSELKEPKYYTTKGFAAISSVTPQYVTTQTINNGKPFLGSQVGTALRGVDKNQNISASTTPAPTTTWNPFKIGKTDHAFTTFTTENPTTLTNLVPTELFNVGRTDKTLRPFAYSTVSSFISKYSPNVTIPSEGSFNVGASSNKPEIESSTNRIIDHATVYGKFVKSSATTPSSGKTTILLSKPLFGGSTVNTPSPFSLQSSQYVNFGTSTTSNKKSVFLSKSVFGTPVPFSKSTTTGASAEILTASDSLNRGIPQVRFFGKVQTTPKIPGVELNFNGNSKNLPSGFNTFSTTATSFAKTSSGPSSTPLPLSSSSRDKPFSTTISPDVSISTFNPDSNSVTPTYSPTFSTESNSVNPTTFEPFSTITPSTTRRPFGTTHIPRVSGFFVTRNPEFVPTQRSRIGDIVRPRPFQLPPEPDYGGKAVYMSTTDNSNTTPAPTYPTYKISSASPFAGPSTPEPTLPTPFTTAQPTLPSTFENVDSMITALAEMATHNNFSSEGPRPGLVIPPSAGPQTLHTLAVYFANALDGIASEKEEEVQEEEERDPENLTKVELEKKKLTELLTQMTMDRYNELFHEDKEANEDVSTSTVSSRSGVDDDIDLEGQHSKGLVQETPKVRQLAKVFTQALSSYLDDPATFKKVLEEVRPTEPPELESENSTDSGDDELLNFSDADSKSSYPPFLPTIPAARPTWGYLIAYNTSHIPQNVDIRNAIGPESENLQGADSQSFISQFNKLQKERKESTTKSSIFLPEDHWTTSPDVNRLWKKAFSFDPASINENFGSTEPTITDPEEETAEPETIEHREIKYELKALPQLELNSTQVHGILIDFMNSTKTDDDNRLQRILRKLNTTQDEFLAKMREIEDNPLTRRLILLLINECGSNATDVDAVPVHSLLTHTANSAEALETSSSVSALGARHQEPKTSSSGLEIADPHLADDSQDARALQLLNSLYSIASKFGK